MVIRYLLGFWILDCADELVQLISHSLGVDTTGGRFEVLFIERCTGQSQIGDDGMDIRRGSLTIADAPLTRGALTPGTSKDIIFRWDGG